MQTKQLEAKRLFINGKIIIGCDPSKSNFQMIPVDEIGIPRGKSFSIRSSSIGFHDELWKKLKQSIGEVEKKKIVFAIESSIDFWQKLSQYLYREGYEVVLVSPLYTKHERPKINNNFSRTDPRDALAVANLARSGYFMFYREYEPEMNAMHDLSITYEKLKENFTQTKQRIRSQMEIIFPEFLKIISLHSDTARYLLSKYMTPEEFSKMNIFAETSEVERISGKQIGAVKLQQLKEAGKHSIGLKLSSIEVIVHRATLNCWLGQYTLFEEQIKPILDKLIELAERTPYFKILTSIKGISDVTAARTIAELRDFGFFNHYRKIEAFSGINLRLSESGKYSGNRVISHIGNRRLRSLLFTMSNKTKEYIPEVGIRYIKRQMKHSRQRKNVTACISNLLKLITVLIKENRTYEVNEKRQEEFKILKENYQQYKDQKKKYRKTA